MWPCYNFNNYFPNFQYNCVWNYLLCFQKISREIINTKIHGKFECDLIMVFVPLCFWARFPAPSDLDSQSALHPLTALRQWQCTVDMISYKDQNHKIALVSKQCPWDFFKPTSTNILSVCLNLKLKKIILNYRSNSPFKL